MEISAVIEKIEDGIAFLTASEFGAFFKIPQSLIGETVIEGQQISVKLDVSGNFVISN